MKWSGPENLPVYPWWDYAEGFRAYYDYPNITRELMAQRIGVGVIAGILSRNLAELYEKVVG